MSDGRAARGLQEVLRGPLHRSLHEVPTNQAEALAERLVARDAGAGPIGTLGHQY